jgi:hypothetical protein
MIFDLLGCRGVGGFAAAFISELLDAFFGAGTDAAGAAVSFFGAELALTEDGAEELMLGVADTFPTEEVLDAIC